MPIEFAPPPVGNLQGFQIPSPQSTDPLATLAQMQQMKTQRIQQQNAQLQLQQAQMKMASQKAMLQAFIDAGKDQEPAPQTQAAPPQAQAPVPQTAPGVTSPNFGTLPNPSAGVLPSTFGTLPTPDQGIVPPLTTAPSGTVTPSAAPSAAAAPSAPSGFGLSSLSSPYLDRVFRNAVRNGALPEDLTTLQTHILNLEKQSLALDETKRTMLNQDIDTYRGRVENVIQKASKPDANPQEVQSALDSANQYAYSKNLPQRGNFTPLTQFSDIDHLRGLSSSLAGYSELLGEAAKQAEAAKNVAQTGEATAATAKTTTETAGLQRGQAIAEYQSGPKTPAAWAALRTKYPNAGLPDSVPSGQREEDFVLSGVPLKDQADYLIKYRQAKAMASMTPQAWDSYVDSVVPPGGDTAALNNRTKGLVRGALATKSPFDAVQAIVKDASDQIGRTETGVRTAKATEPIKINLAGAETAARNQLYQLSPEALDMAAEYYRNTGQLPSIGRNPAAQSQIINRAGQMGPLNLATEKAAYGANKASLAALVKSRDAVTAFETTAGKNLDLFLNQAQKIIDSGSPWINTPLRSLSGQGLGSADQAAANAARQIAVNEIAKVTGSPSLSGALSDSARHEVDAFIPKNATFAQSYRVAQVLRQDMKNRTGSLNDQIDDVSRRIGAGATTNRGATGGGGDKVYTQANVDAAVKAHPGTTAQQIEDAFKAKGWTKQ
jgi:hypothetical protein